MHVFEEWDETGRTKENKPSLPLSEWETNLQPSFYEVMMM